MSLKAHDRRLDRRQVRVDDEASSMLSKSMGISSTERGAKRSGKKSHDRGGENRKVREIRRGGTRRPPDKHIDHAVPREMAAELAPAVTDEIPAEKKGKKRGGFPRTDAGNAELFATLFGKMFRYDYKRKRWLKWPGNWWVEDKRGIVMQFAKEAARYRLRQSADLEDEKERRAEARWAFESESQYGLNAMLNLARSEPPIADTGENWDRDPWLLGVANGVLNLRTGKLRKGKQEDRITMHMNVPFDPKTKSELWLKFLNDVFDGNQKLIDYVQRCIGYCLTGSTRGTGHFLWPWKWRERKEHVSRSDPLCAWPLCRCGSFFDV